MCDLQYFISIYTHIGALQSAHKLVQRHDQAMALWCLKGKNLELLRYWEFERFTGIKGHGISFPSSEACIRFINHLLRQEGFSLDNISFIVGTDNIIPSKSDISFKLVEANISYHSLCHVFSGIFLYSDLFHHSNILCLALDAGPDHVLDTNVWEKNHYIACYVNHGAMQLSSISSPAIFWALLREKLGLAEGTLMALGSATQCRALIDLPSAPKIMSLKDRYIADDWIESILSTIESFSLSDLHILFTGFDDRFSFTENKISIIVKIVSEQSIKMVENTIQDAIKQYNIIPEQTYLSMTGGFALNCPINSYLIKRFSFKGLVAPPVVNDSGMALGMGLHYAYNNYQDFSFSFKNAYYGCSSELTTETLQSCFDLIESISEWDEDRVVDDILDGPIVWFDGNSEIGPRALGHRSLLADPRREDSVNRLNIIKQREWWRPVAPITDIAFVHEWFDIVGDSPFMLQAVPIHSEKRALIPAVCHLDGTARVQTVSGEDCPRLYAVIKAFYKKTGVPMLCNTSLNDKDEPIINTARRALSFAFQKNISIAYINGQRVKVRRNLENKKTNLKEEYFLQNFFESDLEINKEHNPFNLSRKELFNYFSDPRLLRYNLKNKDDVDTLRRIFSINEKHHNGATKRMLWKQ